MSNQLRGLVVAPSRFLILPLLLALVFAAVAIVAPVHRDYTIWNTSENSGKAIQDASAKVDSFLAQAVERFIRLTGERLHSIARIGDESAADESPTRRLAQSGLAVAPNQPETRELDQTTLEERSSKTSSSAATPRNDLEQEFLRLGKAYFEENYGATTSKEAFKAAFMAFSSVGEREALRFLESEIEKLRQRNSSRKAFDRLNQSRTIVIGSVSVPLRPVYVPVAWFSMAFLLASVLGFFRLQVFDTLQRKVDSDSVSEKDGEHHARVWGNTAPPIWLAPLAATGWHRNSVQAEADIKELVGWSPERSRMNVIAMGVMLLTFLTVSIWVLVVSIELSVSGEPTANLWGVTTSHLLTLRIASIVLFWLTWGCIGVAFVTPFPWRDDGLVSGRRAVVLGGLAFAGTAIIAVIGPFRGTPTSSGTLQASAPTLLRSPRCPASAPLGPNGMIE